MKIGVLTLGYNCEEYLEEALAPWKEYKDKHKGGLYFVAMHACFKEYQEMGFSAVSPDETEKLLLKHKEETGLIDDLTFTEESLVENEVKTICLQKLLDADVDLVWHFGLDELHTIEEIEGIVQFINWQKYVDWYHVSYKNYLFDSNTWVDGFCPPRIFWTDRHGGLDAFHEDDFLSYKDGSYCKRHPHLHVPKNVAHVRHMTWLNNEKSKKKYEYQKARWGESFCSYKWNYDKEELEFNDDYYKTHKKMKPSLNYD